MRLNGRSDHGLYSLIYKIIGTGRFSIGLGMTDI
jgi:hypothetical protein